MKIAIVKYNAGNVESVKNALNRLGVEPVLTDSAGELQTADKVIFPGVGEASTAMRYLREKNLDAVIKNLRQPVLGVCLGMQLLGDFSEENEIECLGIVPFRVKKFQSAMEKVPHVGWNQIGDLKSRLFENIGENSFVYFVHSYFVPKNPATVADCSYIETFSAAVNHQNFYGVQFHTEKSGKVGEAILENFLKL
ncbi:MAG: imidazole glycerol phosphate synthase subunit HisH [Acidobacteriota bacterium]|nr:imidazole glycerol phosphate synthase subunit HisH [Acidobacteriota bacterium]